VKMTLKAGDAVLMDTRVMHCGGSNQSDRSRMLFHFSLETTAEPKGPVGFTYNLAPELRGKLTLADISSGTGVV
jgi:ectoine hydroxylase-related dioxygenase (phytanoyl-CoA dioxygenase family)